MELYTEDAFFDPDPVVFAGEVRRACRSYLNSSTLSDLHIAKVAANIVYKTAGPYPDEVIFARLYCDADVPEWYFDYYYSYRQLGRRERERATRTIALMDAMDLCINRMRESYYQGLDKLAIDCLCASLEPMLSEHIASLPRNEYYKLLRRGIALLTYHLAEYFAKYYEDFNSTANVLQIIEGDKLTIRISPRERTVLQLAAQGHSDTKTIAKHLGVSIHTVETYWKRIRRKLDAQNRTEAITEAYRQGIIN